MFSTINIWESASGFAFGAAIVLIVLWWRNRNTAIAQRRQAEELLAASRREAGELLAQARLTANEDALKLRRETEESFTEQRKEQAERERRLMEREGLLNSQLERVMKSERLLDERSRRRLVEQDDDHAAEGTESAGWRSSSSCASKAEAG